MVRGIISPPRSRSSPRERTPFNNNAPTNPPSRPNYMSPRRRPTTPVNPNEQPSHRRETHSTAVKSSAVRATKANDRSSNTSRIDPSKSTSKPAISRRQTAAPNPNEKKLDSNGPSTKTAAKISSKSSSPLSTKPISQPPRGLTPSKGNVKGSAIGCGPRSDVSGAKASGVASQNHFDSRNDSPKHLASGGSLGHQQDSKVGDVGNQKRHSGGHFGGALDQLQQLSIDGEVL